MYNPTVSRLWSQYRTLWLLLLNSLFVVFVTVFCSSHFETNDDVVMAWIASGQYSGTPDAHLVFINILYGYVVAALYRLMPGFEWYTCMFAIAHIVSLTIIGGQILDSKLHRYSRMAAMLLCYVIEVWALLLLQFTTTAALLATASLSLVMTSQTPWQRVAGVLIFVWAALVRFKAAMLVGVVFACYYPWSVYVYGFNWRRLATLAVCVVSGVAVQYIHFKSYFNDSRWAYYYEYNINRGKINDNPNAGAVREKLPPQVRLADYILLCNFFADTDVTDLKDLQDINEVMDQVSLRQKINNWQKLKNLWNQFKWLIVITLVVMVATAVALREKWWLAFVPIAGCMLVVLLIALNGAVKIRIFYTILLAVYVFMSQLHKPVVKYVSPVLLALCMVGFVKAESTFDYHNGFVIARYERNLMRDLPDDVTLCGWSAIIKSEYVNPWQVSSYFPMQIKGKGWLASSPFNDDIAAYTDFIGTNNAVFILNSQADKAIKLLTASIRQNYHKDVEPNWLMQSRFFSVFNFKEKVSE
ncbi:MAG: hypothetical protein J5808_03870 [Paludibacteraceae bacterium]|nr:hypothetical protein [Paludibacteraceae bacterium]